MRVERSRGRGERCLRTSGDQEESKVKTRTLPKTGKGCCTRTRFITLRVLHPPSRQIRGGTLRVGPPARLSWGDCPPRRCERKEDGVGQLSHSARRGRVDLSSSDFQRRVS